MGKGQEDEFEVCCCCGCAETKVCRFVTSGVYGWRHPF